MEKFRQKVDTVSLFLFVFSSSWHLAYAVMLKASDTVPRPSILLKRRHQHNCFPVNFVKFLKTTFFVKYLR